MKLVDKAGGTRIKVKQRYYGKPTLSSVLLLAFGAETVPPSADVEGAITGLT